MMKDRKMQAVMGVDVNRHMSKKLTFSKELTPSLQTYELHGQGEKKKEKRNYQNQDKQTPHTILQKLPPKTTHLPSSETLN